jgi:CrcB protein
LKNLFLIGLAGGAGSVARHLLAGLLPPRSGFPVGTLAVNLLGSLLLAVVARCYGAKLIAPELRLALATGLLGGFTTYSSFNMETLALLDGGQWKTGALYLLATVGGCLLAGALGWTGARWVTGS